LVGPQQSAPNAFIFILVVFIPDLALNLPIFILVLLGLIIS
tara:strand:- start:46 stop:168 length:123 start_codon:yes stop_codon:yes gene_type:complete